MPGAHKEMVMERQRRGLEVLKDFPEAGSLTLAKILHRDHPDLWLDVEQARTWVRYKKGLKGESSREKESEYHRTPREPGDPFGKLPKSLVALDESAPYKLSCNRCLVLADVHIPYHDDTALRVALKHAQKEGIDAIVLLGDLMDCYAVSSYVTDPRQRNMAGEIRATKEFLRTLRNVWPDAKIVYKAGNHEERWERYLFCRAPDVIGISDFEIDQVLALDDLGITWLDRMRHVRIDHLNLVHGHEFGQSAYSPVNAARGLFLRSTAIAMCGHWHQTSQHSETTMDDNSIACWSIGTLGDLHPRYKRYNARWNHGFAIVEVDGGFRVKNHRIVKGVVY